MQLKQRCPVVTCVAAEASQRDQTRIFLMQEWVFGNHFFLFLPPNPCPTWPVILVERWNPDWPGSGSRALTWRESAFMGRFLPQPLLADPCASQLSCSSEVVPLGLMVSLSLSFSQGSGVD